MEDFCPTFTFKQFAVDDRRCGLKVGTDGVLLGAWAQCTISDARILDVGAGSGLVGLMLAQRYPDATIEAVEIDGDAYADWLLNASRSPWAGRCTCVHGDYRCMTDSYDLIACNPPFFATGERAQQASRALARHSGDLSPVSFIHYAASHLRPGGQAALIAPVEFNDELLLEAAVAGLQPVRTADVATSARRGITRRLWQFAAETPSPARHCVITVGSDDFKTLTQDFYL